MSKEKGTPAAAGTGAKAPVIQKLHTTGEKNVKFKLNFAAAKGLRKGKKAVIKLIQTRLKARGI